LNGDGDLEGIRPKRRSGLPPQTWIALIGAIISTSAAVSIAGFTLFYSREEGVQLSAKYSEHLKHPHSDVDRRFSKLEVRLARVEAEMRMLAERRRK